MINNTNSQVYVNNAWDGETIPRLDNRDNMKG